MELYPKIISEYLYSSFILNQLHNHNLFGLFNNLVKLPVGVPARACF